MIEIDIPGYRTLQLSYLVLDHNGTLAVGDSDYPVTSSGPQILNGQAARHNRRDRSATWERQKHLPALLRFVAQSAVVPTRRPAQFQMGTVRQQSVGKRIGSQPPATSTPAVDSSTRRIQAAGRGRTDRSPPKTTVMERTQVCRRNVTLPRSTTPPPAHH